MNIFVFLVLVGLLSSLLLLTTTTTVTNNYLVLGQDDDDDDKDNNDNDSSNSNNDEEEKDQTNDGDEEEPDPEMTMYYPDPTTGEVVEQEEEQQQQEETKNTSLIAEPLQQISEGWNDISKTKQELEEQKQQVLTEEQQFKEQLKSILIDINLDGPVTTTAEPITTTSELSCNCTPAIDDGGAAAVAETTPTKPVQSAVAPSTSTPEQELQQIIINPSDIVNYKSIGSVTNTDYINTFNPANVLDNVVGGETSYWSQYGKSGFLIQLKGNALNDWEVCSAEINAYQPKNVPFTLAIQAGQNFTGVLDGTVENVDFGQCVQNVNKIMMYFDSPDKYTSISELKLFGKPVNANEPQPPVPPLEPSDPKIIEIKNSNAEINIDNSTVVLKFGSNTYKIDPESNIVLIPNKEVMN